MEQIPTFESSAQVHVHLFGDEKGGVGKSLVSRLLDHGDAEIAAAGV
jgi:hypothetical protein